MRFLLFLVLATALALGQARTLRESSESRESPEASPSWSHRHSSVWPCDVADHPQSYVLMPKVEKRLDRIDNEQLRKRIVEYVTDQLRQCKSHDQMDEHCVKRSIGYAMSFINHQKEQAKRL
ncbi:uncharacterized protein LOC117585404 [Drosophila guanche]|uniref:Uncharacterized protein n=1 Tax=Drosophila guanche TaxID=7266 RepID=A0A3B0KGZ0_DROGU|nr:uncharacterized protein LOC117585404 [Drosophila guanche]SPP82938.1 Hypothetical predicted protein [Drosophila guanche]